MYQLLSLLCYISIQNSFYSILIWEILFILDTIPLLLVTVKKKKEQTNNPPSLLLFISEFLIFKFHNFLPFVLLFVFAVLS